MMTRLRAALFVLTAAAALGACSGEGRLRCESPRLYATSSTAPPVRVPDGLSVPDESQALQIPPGETPPIPGEDDPPSCLERPPSFFDEGQESGR